MNDPQAPDSRPTALPPRYAQWVAGALGSVPDPEPGATCFDCVMCAPETPITFNEAVKCCSFVPDLPNFSVGGILRDPDPALAPGRAAIRRRIAEGIASTPLGLGSTAGEDALRALGGEQAFGSATSLRCPYYIEDGGLCGVWRFRDSTCSTWFCRHERGLRGERVWRAIQRLLIEIESALTVWCLLQLDLEPETLDTLFPAPRVIVAQQRTPPDPSGVMDEHTKRAAWGTWYGREEALYAACSELVEPLDWPAIQAIGDSGLEVALRVARATIAALDAPPPDHLAARLPVVVQLADRHVDVLAYSPYDPLRVPRRVFDALHHFDGRPTEKALRAIELEEGYELSAEAVGKLADFGVLVDVGE